MFSLRQIASLIQCGGPVTNLHNPERQFTEVERSGHRVERFYAGDHQIDDPPSTDRPMKFGRKLARSRYDGLVDPTVCGSRHFYGLAVIRPSDVLIRLPFQARILALAAALRFGTVPRIEAKGDSQSSCEGRTRINPDGCLSEYGNLTGITRAKRRGAEAPEYLGMRKRCATYRSDFSAYLFCIQSIRKA
jgi:hypothetical protein